MLTDEQIADVKARAAKNAYFAHDPESYRLNRVIEEMATEYGALRGAVAFHLRNEHTERTDPARGEVETVSLTLTREERNLAEYALHDYLNDPEPELGEGDLELIRAVGAKLRDALGREGELG